MENITQRTGKWKHVIATKQLRANWMAGPTLDSHLYKSDLIFGLSLLFELAIRVYFTFTLFIMENSCQEMGDAGNVNKYTMVSSN